MGHVGMNHGGHSSGSEGGSDPSVSPSHASGGGISVLVELVARPTLERVWFGTGDLIPSKHAAEGHGSALLEGTVKRLLEPLPGEPMMGKGPDRLKAQ